MKFPPPVAPAAAPPAAPPAALAPALAPKVTLPAQASASASPLLPPAASAPASALGFKLGRTKVKAQQIQPDLTEVDFPNDLRDQLLELEEWAIANKKDASRDTLAFWSLKLPAILVAASAGVWAHFELTTVGVVAGAVASLCVIVDGIH